MNQRDVAELKSVIRGRFKLLRQDVDLRRQELLRQLDEEIAARFKAEDEAWRMTLDRVEEARRECNRAVNDIFREAYGKEKWGTSHDRNVVQVLTPQQQYQVSRVQLQREGQARIEALVASALQELDRREIRLREQLVLGHALESEEAQRFCDSIPTVGDLVPASRLLELQASMGVS